MHIDLQNGIVPISKAASHLAKLIAQARHNEQPIIVTQKGYPTGIILSVGLYTRLVERQAETSARQGMEDTNAP